MTNIFPAKEEIVFWDFVWKNRRRMQDYTVAMLLHNNYFEYAPCIYTHVHRYTVCNVVHVCEHCVTHQSHEI